MVGNINRILRFHIYPKTDIDSYVQDKEVLCI